MAGRVRPPAPNPPAILPHYPAQLRYALSYQSSRATPRRILSPYGPQLLGSCKTPDLAEKEVLAYMVAYNLIRFLMAEAVARAQVDMERVSFKGTVDAVRQYTSTSAIQGARNRNMRH